MDGKAYEGNLNIGGRQAKHFTMNVDMTHSVQNYIMNLLPLLLPSFITPMSY